MQTAERTFTAPAPRCRQHPLAGKRTGTNKQRSKQSHKNIAQERPANGFLTARFSPIPISDFDPLFSHKNFMYLYKSVKNYLGLLGVETKTNPDSKDIEALCKELGEHLEQHQEYMLYEKDGCLHLKVMDNREDYQFYFIPCAIIDRTEGILKEILVSFFSLLQRSQRLTPLSESYFMEMMYEDVYCQRWDNDTDNPSEWDLLLKEYQEGNIRQTLDLVEKDNKYSIPEMKGIIKEYIPASEKESSLLGIILKGLDLFRQGKAILHYAKYPDIDYDYYPAIDIDRIFQIVYDDDLMLENQIDFTMHEVQESAFEFISGGSIELTPETKEVLKIDEYVIDFIDWLKMLCHELYHY